MLTVAGGRGAINYSQDPRKGLIIKYNQNRNMSRHQKQVDITLENYPSWHVPMCFLWLIQCISLIFSHSVCLPSQTRKHGNLNLLRLTSRIFFSPWRGELMCSNPSSKYIKQEHVLVRLISDAHLWINQSNQRSSHMKRQWFWQTA